MKKTLLLFFVGWGIFSPCSGQDILAISDLFTIKCGICHTIGGGKLIGPDLTGARDRHSEEWLLEFIRSSQKMINDGDPTAVSLYEEYNKVLMPDPLISDDEIISLLNYIDEQSGDGSNATKPYVSVLEGASAEDVESGKSLFEGKKLFANGGPSCFSCHNDITDYFFSDHSLSTKDVRTSFINLGEQGVKAILENPPFPVMRQALKGHALEEDEVHDLLAYLKSAGSVGPPPTKSSGYLLYGILGAVLIFFFYAALWYERKSKSVNHQIYKRQIRSAN